MKLGEDFKQKKVRVQILSLDKGGASIKGHSLSFLVFDTTCQEMEKMIKKAIRESKNDS